MSNHIPAIRNMVLTILPALAICFSLSAFADPLLETRYVTEIKRDANGQIVRRADVRAAFKKIHVCPSTGKTIGACDGWQIDHTIPLKCFGSDSVSNLAWLPIAIKSRAGIYPKDRWELKVYCKPRQLVILPNVQLQPIWGSQ